MGFSCGCKDDFDIRESEVPLIDDSRESSSKNRGSSSSGMEVQHHGIEFDIGFWPVEHPLEPQDDDRPVKCPIPTSSLINEGRIQEERLSDSLRKRAELAKKQEIVMETAEPHVRAVRKRHHTLTRDDCVMMKMPLPPTPPLPTQKNITIFQMLQQVEKFES